MTNNLFSIPPHRRSNAMQLVFGAILLAVMLGAGGKLAHADVRTAHPTLVSENASFFTPGLVDGRVEAIAIDGDTVFVGGTFTQVQMALDGEIIDQAYLFAYSKSTGDIIRDFDPILDRAVRALQTTGDGTGIFAGGEFTAVNGESNRRGLIKLDNLGDRVKTFGARVNKRVYTMGRSGNTLYIGGNFDRVNKQPTEFVAAIDATTGELLPNLNLDFEGVLTTDVVTGFPSVDAIEVTSDGRLMVVVGNFTYISWVSTFRQTIHILSQPPKDFAVRANLRAIARCDSILAI